MSGEYFSHRWVLSDMAEDIDKCVLTNKIPNEWDEVRDYPDEVLQKFTETADDLRRLSRQVYYIDYLGINAMDFSGDHHPDYDGNTLEGQAMASWCSGDYEEIGTYIRTGKLLRDRLSYPVKDGRKNNP